MLGTMREGLMFLPSSARQGALKLPADRLTKGTHGEVCVRVATGNSPPRTCVWARVAQG